MKFQQTKIEYTKLKLAWRNLASGFCGDLANDLLRPMVPRVLRDALRKPHPSITKPSVDHAGKPLIFVSYATDETLKGSHHFCGGEKVLNNLVLLLRRKGYDAFMVTLDGRQSGWLVEHAPCISLEECRERMKTASSIRCVTSWIKAKAFLDLCPGYYFWDQELASTSRSQFPELADQMIRGRIVRTAGVNRVIQTWHRTVFGRETHILRQLLDEHHWLPDPSRRIRNRVGYFDEGEHGAEYIRIIREFTCRAGLDLEFHELRGIEGEIISQMQTCSVCLVLNIGKSSWGEGGPLTPWEAMACGAVPVSFDLKGAWELIQQNHNGIITREINPELMADALILIYGTPGRLEEMSRRGIETIAAAHTLEVRWPDAARFLDLPLGAPEAGVTR